MPRQRSVANYITCAWCGGKVKDDETCPCKHKPYKPYRPKTGEVCHCRRGIERDNCPQCEGTGMRIDFEAIRARVTEEKKYSAIADPCTTERCVNPAMTWRRGLARQ